MKLSIVDLFCGAGGLSLGLQDAGLQLVSAIDNWEPAVATYRLNLGDHIQKLPITHDLQLPQCDVIAGGPPCQGFSSAGARRDTDQRNTLVGVFARLVARHRPRAFVFENVEGFLTGAQGDFVIELLEPLIAAGYFIHVKKINAANYGVPQHRKRVIAIGGLGWEPVFPKATHFAFGAPGATRHAALGLPRTPTVNEALMGLREHERDLNDHAPQTLSATDLARARALQQGQTMKDLPEDLQHDSYKRRAFRRVQDGTPTEKRGGAPSGVRRLRGDEPSKAITGAASREFLHHTEDRPLTIRECATLQTFPTSFNFSGANADRMQMIGNGVPPLLGRAIGTALIAGIDNAVQQTDSGSPGRLLSFIPTVAEGMSPVLQQVCIRVAERFGSIEKSTGTTGDFWA
jgi:DNA (cytosine-5)-methyltransferase 1